MRNKWSWFAVLLILALSISMHEVYFGATPEDRGAARYAQGKIYLQFHALTFGLFDRFFVPEHERITARCLHQQFRTNQEEYSCYQNAIAAILAAKELDDQDDLYLKKQLPIDLESFRFWNMEKKLSNAEQQLASQPGSDASVAIFTRDEIKQKLSQSMYYSEYYGCPGHPRPSCDYVSWPVWVALYFMRCGCNIGGF